MASRISFTHSSRLQAKLDSIKSQGFDDALDCLRDFCSPGLEADSGEGWDAWLLSAGCQKEVFGGTKDQIGSKLFSDCCAAYCKGGDQAVAQYNQELSASLKKADDSGYRVCVFGLPGSNTHVVRLASSVDDAIEISKEIFQPGPFGPYDSLILTISEAATRTYRDGTPIYGDEVADAIR